MKQLILIALTATLFSCSNKKAEIVEQIKSYKDSLNLVSAGESELLAERNNLMKSYSDSVKPMDFDNALSAESKKNTAFNIELQKRQTDAELELSRKQGKRKAELFTKRIIFKSKIDSLELELKKY